MSQFASEGSLANGMNYALYGRAVSGEGRALAGSGDILQVGEDTAIIIPSHNVVAVFDGSSGTEAIGSPLVAARTAARAARRFFTHGVGESPAAALEYARDAVIANDEASVCVGAIARFTHENKIETAYAGDTIVATYDTATKDNTILTPPQRDQQGIPRNYLGKPMTDFTPTLSDASRTTELRQSEDVFVMSDGAYDHHVFDEEGLATEFTLAYEDVQLLRQALRHIPKLEQKLRHEILDGAPNASSRQATKRDMSEFYEVLSSITPHTLRLDSLPWRTWNYIVKPYISYEAPNLRQAAVNGAAICHALVERPIQTLPKPPADDATVVMLSPRLKH